MNGSPEKDPILDALWARVLEAWDDEKIHAGLLEQALRSKNLPDLAGRYRALKDDADKGPIAKKRLDAIVIAATQMLMTMKTPAPTRNPLWLTASAALVMLVLLLWVAYALFKR